MSSIFCGYDNNNGKKRKEGKKIQISNISKQIYCIYIEIKIRKKSSKSKRNEKREQSYFLTDFKDRRGKKTTTKFFFQNVKH